MEKKDSVIEIPFTRWDLDVYYSPDPDAPGKTYAKHGGFIEGAPTALGAACKGGHVCKLRFLGCRRHKSYESYES